MSKFGRWVAMSKFMSFPRSLIIEAFSRLYLALVSFSSPERAKVFDLIRKVKKEVRMLMSYAEAYNLFMAVKRTYKVSGDLAEVGVYRGGSSKIICETKGDKTLHLFDTFEGIPSVTARDNMFKKGDFGANLDEVKKYLGRYDNVLFYKGTFPDTGKGIESMRFSFVHIDVDTHKSTADSIRFFHPRMNPGGIILCHDYASVPSVKEAIDNFFQDKPEPVIELAGSQCLIQKV